jgi:multiple sugar transport system permease protein
MSNSEKTNTNPNGGGILSTFRPAYVIEAIVFGVFLTVALAPVVWGIATSFKPTNQIFSYPPRLLSESPSLEHYRTIIKSGFFQSLFVSIFNSSLSIVVGVSLAALAGYGFDRYRFPMRKAAFMFVVIGIPLAIGSSALLIPNYLFLSRLGLTDRRLTLVLIYTAYNLPMAIWIMKGIFESIPVSIDESAKLDGCSDFYILWKLLLPITKPALAAAALFIFIGSWNEFIAASVMVSSRELRPVQLAIYNFMGYFGLEWGPLMASATLAVVPIIFVFTRLGRMLVSGLTKGSTKG